MDLKTQWADADFDVGIWAVAIKTADWVIDLGPEGGDGGGQVVAEGTPEQLARAGGSFTGRYLKRVLTRGRKAA